MHERALVLNRLDLLRGRRVLARGLSLRVDAGERGMILGGNGSGKTTLVMTVCGLLPSPAGTVTRPERVGFVPQEPDFPRAMRCGDYLRQLAALGGARDGAAVEQADAVLRRFQLAGSEQRRIGELSRGWRQRLNLARGWLGAPQLLVLDEPQTALDPEGMDALRRAIEADDAPTLLLVAPEGVGCDGIAPVILDLASCAAGAPAEGSAR